MITKRLRVTTAAALLAGTALLSLPALSQQVKSVAGVTINLGLMPAAVALRADGHRDAHPTNPPSGSQHLLVTLDDETSRSRIGDAQVLVEVTDPRGHMEKKPLLRTQAGGLPDYSELFTFGWSGEYKIHVIVTLRPGASPIETRFTVRHVA